MTADRRAELGANLQSVTERIEQARVAAGRSDRVGLVVVTKTFPASDVGILATLGATDVGENRDQEARLKRAELSDDIGSAAPLRWHMIGQLQRNKARSVATWADVVESVDRPELVVALERGAEAAERELDVLLQVNLDPEPDSRRGGVAPEGAGALAAVVAEQAHLRLRGVMGVAPHPGGAPDPRHAARAAFDRLMAVAAGLRVEHPEATVVSAGMSTDLEEAIAAGATQVRVGGAILGARPPVQ